MNQAVEFRIHFHEGDEPPTVTHRAFPHADKPRDLREDFITVDALVNGVELTLIGDPAAILGFTHDLYDAAQDAAFKLNSAAMEAQP